jgi:hypothetical protein
MPISDTDQHTPFINIVADGVTSIDTFNTWRKKTNGIIKVINDGLITSYIADRAITPSKLSEGGPYWDRDGTFNTNGNTARVGFGRGDTINLYIGHSRSTVGTSSLIFRTAATGGIGTDTASITRNSGLTGDLTIYNNSSPIKLSVDASQKIFFNVNGSEIANVSNTGINVVNTVTAKNVSLSDAIPYYRLQSSASDALTWNIESNSGSLYVRSGATTAAANSVAPIRVLNNNTVALGGKLNDVIVSTDELTVFGDSLFTGEIRNNTSITAGYKISSGETSVKVGAERTADGISSLQLYSTKYGSGNTTPSANITRAAGVNSNLTIKNTGSGQTVFEQDDNGSYSFKIGASERLNIDKAGKITIAGTLKVVGGFTTDTPITGANISNRLINAFGDGYVESINIAAGTQNITTVTLTVQDHGFQIGETVTISGLKKGDGTLTPYANGEKTIIAVTTDTFSYAVVTPAPAPFSFDVSTATLSSIAANQSYFKLGTAVPEDYYLIVGGNRSAADQTGIVLRSQSGNWKPTADSNQYDTSGLHIYKGSGINGNAGIENSGTGTFTLANKDSGNIIFSTAVSGTTYQRLTINGVTGAVGIGTATTPAALTVSGNIGATRFVGPLTGAVTGKADTAGTADTSLVLETLNIKIDADSIKSNGTLKLNTTKKDGTSAATALDTAVYDGKSGLIATFKGGTKALETEGDIVIAPTKKLNIEETNTANRRARAQIGSWYIGQSSLSNGTSDFYIHNGDDASITTPRLKIDGSTGLITGRITNADVAVNLSSTLPIDKGGTGAITAAAALSALGGAPLASPTFTGTPKVPEPGVNSNDTQIATTAFVLSKVSSGIQAANAPTKTGSGASGNWGISITGTAEVAKAVSGGAIVPASLTATNSTWNFKNKVGVNVTSPSFQFEVTDTLATRSVGIGQSEIKFRGDGLTHWSIYGSRDSKDYFDIQNTSNAVTPGVDGTSCFRITKTGNIGLGVSNPTRRLEVDGSVVATSFIGSVSGSVSGSSGSCIGNAATVTNGVYTNAANSITGSLGFGSHGTNTISNGNGDNATLSAYNLSIKSWWGIGFPSYDNVNRIVLDTRTGGAQFSGTITAPTFSGNATSVTNGVYTSGDQVINGVKTFTSVIRLDDAGIMFNSDGGKDTGFTWHSDGIFNVRCNAATVGTFRSTGWNGPVVGTVTGNVTGSSGSCTGNAATATNATNAGYATTAGYANDYEGRVFLPAGRFRAIQETWRVDGGGSSGTYAEANNAYVDLDLNNLSGTGFVKRNGYYRIFVEIHNTAGNYILQHAYNEWTNNFYETIWSGIDLGSRPNAEWTFHARIRDGWGGKISKIIGFTWGNTSRSTKDTWFD